MKESRNFITCYEKTYLTRILILLLRPSYTRSYVYTVRKTPLRNSIKKKIRTHSFGETDAAQNKREHDKVSGSIEKKITKMAFRSKNPFRGKWRFVSKNS